MRNLIRAISLAGLLVATGGAEAMDGPVEITLGMTVYNASDGAGLACGGRRYRTDKKWVAVPIEWVLGGYVSCGDKVYACTDDGTCIEGLPVWDTGCLLHYNVWDSVGKGGYPFGIDLPLHVAKSMHFTTRSATMKIWRTELGEWWDIPPLTAWGSMWCDGPLTAHPDFKYEPY